MKLQSFVLKDSQRLAQKTGLSCSNIYSYNVQEQVKPGERCVAWGEEVEAWIDARMTARDLSHSSNY